MAHRFEQINNTQKTGDVMGLFDNVQQAMNRGVATAGRTANSTKLKMQQADIARQRKELAAQLGAALYEATKDDAALRAGREQLYDGIANLDKQSAEIDAQLRQIAEQAAAEAQAAQAKAQARAAAQQATSGPRCPSCGAPIGEGDLFCMSCGTKIELPKQEPEPARVSAKEPVSSSEAAPEPAGETAPEADPASKAVPALGPEPVAAPEAEPVAAPKENGSAPEISAMPALSDLPSPASIDMKPSPVDKRDDEPAMTPAPEPAAQTSSATPSAAAPAPAEKDGTSGGFCPNCGKPVLAEDLFCSSCGNRLC